MLNKKEWERFAFQIVLPNGSVEGDFISLARAKQYAKSQNYKDFDIIIAGNMHFVNGKEEI